MGKADGKRGAVKSGERPLPPFSAPLMVCSHRWWASSKQCIHCGWGLFHPQVYQQSSLGSLPIFGVVGLEVGNYKPGGGRKVGTADGKRGAIKSGGGRTDDLCLLFQPPSLMVCSLVVGLLKTVHSLWVGAISSLL